MVFVRLDDQVVALVSQELRPACPAVGFSDSRELFLMRSPEQQVDQSEHDNIHERDEDVNEEISAEPDVLVDQGDILPLENLPLQIDSKAQ